MTSPERKTLQVRTSSHYCEINAGTEWPPRRDTERSARSVSYTPANSPDRHVYTQIQLHAQINTRTQTLEGRQAVIQVISQISAVPSTL